MASCVFETHQIQLHKVITGKKKKKKKKKYIQIEESIQDYSYLILVMFQFKLFSLSVQKMNKVYITGKVYSYEI